MFTYPALSPVKDTFRQSSQQGDRWYTLIMTVNHSWILIGKLPHSQRLWLQCVGEVDNHVQPSPACDQIHQALPFPLVRGYWSWYSVVYFFNLTLVPGAIIFVIYFLILHYKWRLSPSIWIILVQLLSQRSNCCRPRKCIESAYGAT